MRETAISSASAPVKRFCAPSPLRATGRRSSACAWRRKSCTSFRRRPKSGWIPRSGDALVLGDGEADSLGACLVRGAAGQLDSLGTEPAKKPLDELVLDVVQRGGVPRGELRGELDRRHAEL